MRCGLPIALGLGLGRQKGEIINSKLDFVVDGGGRQPITVHVVHMYMYSCKLQYSDRKFPHFSQAEVKTKAAFFLSNLVSYYRTPAFECEIYLF
jgi:hypothetical protein